MFSLRHVAEKLLLFYCSRPGSGYNHTPARNTEENNAQHYGIILWKLALAQLNTSSKTVDVSTVIIVLVKRGVDTSTR